MPYCNNCGHEVPGGNSFCPGCGAPIQPWASTPVAPNAPQGIPPYGIPSYGYPPYGAPLAPRPAAKYTFLNAYLGIVLLGAMLILPQLLGLLSPHFLKLANITNITRQIAYYGLLALAVALTSRAKGPDISVGAQMTLTGIICAKVVAASGTLVDGALLAVAICAAVGALIGVVSTYLKVPGIFVSWAAYVVIWIVSRPLAVGLNPQTLAASMKSFILPAWAPFAILFAAFVGVFLLIMLTRLRQSVYTRDKNPAIIYVVSYIISGMLAALAGLLLLYRLQMAVPYIGYSGLMFPLLIAGYIACSRLFDNGFMPAILAIVGTVSWAMLQNVLNLLNVSAYIQQAVQGVLIAALGATALIIWFAQRKDTKTAQ